MANPLGKVDYVQIRDIWQDEARDFTPWLATSEGLDMLGDAIDLSLELVAKEAAVGPFSADLLARVIGTDDHLVVVENQFGKTDHDHFGKLMTYASGLTAKTVVWIAESFTDEHRRALDWINETSGERVGFFGLEVFIIRIGSSLPAPQFKVVSSPNLWAQAVRESQEEAELTETKLDQKRFWEELKEFMNSKGTTLPLRKAFPQHWFDISIGRSDFHIALTVNSRLKRVGCELYMSGTKGKQAFSLLSEEKDAIEKDIGLPLEWQPLEGKGSSRIAIYKDADFLKVEERETSKEWLYLMSERFNKVFAPRVKALKLTADN
jgi:hypothetical protein